MLCSRALTCHILGKDSTRTGARKRQQDETGEIPTSFHVIYRPRGKLYADFPYVLINAKSDMLLIVLEDTDCQRKLS